MKPKLLKLADTAKFNCLSRDLYWSVSGNYGKGQTYATLRWTGYDDANWWDNVSSSDQFIKQTAPNGKNYYLNVDTREVFTD